MGRVVHMPRCMNVACVAYLWVRGATHTREHECRGGFMGRVGHMPRCMNAGGRSMGRGGTHASIHECMGGGSVGRGWDTYHTSCDKKPEKLYIN